MSSKTELPNPNVMKFNETHGQLPTQTDYVEAFIAPKLKEAGLTTYVEGYETDDGDEIAVNFAETYFELWQPGQQVAVARVANAGIQLAVQMRKAARQVNSGFDADALNPQLHVITDRFPIADTQERVEDPAHFQSPFTALRQVALTAKLLEEARQQQ